MTNARLALYQIVADRLADTQGIDLKEFISLRRAPENKIPYRKIAAELVDITGVDITHEAVRRWHLDISGPNAGAVPTAADAEA